MQTQHTKTELPQGSLLKNGEFEVIKTLGLGGFGITYLVKHSILKKHFAIKEFFINGYCVRNSGDRNISVQGLDSNSFENYRKKFITEACVLGELEHQNIVSVNDAFNENGTSYFVMPYIKGCSLQNKIESKSVLPYEIAVNYLAQVAEAVAYMHGKSFLHRDIKPDNIMVTPENKVVLIDFGSAREFVHDKTQNHTAILTGGYAPIEQYSKTSKKGNYTDIYSIGAVFYTMLTGQKPLDSTERMMEELIEPKKIDNSISDVVNNTILKAMALRPEDRYQNINEFMKVLLQGNIESIEQENIITSIVNDNKSCDSIGSKLPILKTSVGSIMVMNEDLSTPMRYDETPEKINKLTQHGYSDWRLPDKGELNILYMNKDKIGGFSEAKYWYKNENNKSDDILWAINFKSGKSFECYKSNKAVVRCVRQVVNKDTDKMLMEKHEISFDGEKYCYLEYKYERLEDAIFYAEIKNNG